MILGTQKSPSSFIVSFLITVTAVDIVLVVCITEPLFLCHSLSLPVHFPYYYW